MAKTFDTFEDAQATFWLMLIDIRSGIASGLGAQESMNAAAFMQGFANYEEAEQEAERWGCMPWTKSDRVLEEKRVLH